MSTPLLANIALNFLDWQLEAAGYCFVRYADDFVVLCRSKHQAEEAHSLVLRCTGDLGLTLSPEKTKIAKFKEGFSFLGFTITHRARCMRAKSVEKYKTKIRELTIRSHNLDARAISKINSVIRGVAHARKTHRGKYGELTPLRQRGGRGTPLPYPLKRESDDKSHFGVR